MSSGSVRERIFGRRATIAVACFATALVAPIAVTMLSDSGDAPLGPGRAAAAEGELAAFTDCDQVRDWYVDAALKRVTEDGLPGLWSDEGGPFFDTDSAEAGSDFKAAPSAPTGTNLQEAGVDEPDIVKTDGDLTVSLAGRRLVATDTSGKAPAELGELEDVRFTNGELLLVGDRVIVLGGAAQYWGWGSEGPTWVTTVDLADPARPEVVGSRRLGGSVLSARVTEGTVRVVLATVPDLRFVRPGGRYTKANALAENKEILEASTVADWLPTWTVGKQVTPLVDCAQMTRPAHFAGFGATSVLTIDPATDDQSVTAIAATGGQLYASPDRLYVATNEWGRLGGNTSVHAFGTDAGETTYIGSGRVPGRIPDRWAFSEQDGILRVASMRGKGWRVDETVLTTFEEADGTLRELGSIGGLGEKNEQIQAVRYFGDLAVVVTFRQTDPLYTIDLSDPARPKRLGELKIPGFSAYLHPVGPDTVLGVGRRRDFVQVSLFDLSRLTRPRRIDVRDLDHGRWSWSPVEEDSRAFTWLPQGRLALIPIEGKGTWIDVVKVSGGRLQTIRSIRVDKGYVDSVRALPLGGDRVAVIGNGRVQEILTLG